jgi:hypothetical protein
MASIRSGGVIVSCLDCLFCSMNPLLLNNIDCKLGLGQTVLMTLLTSLFISEQRMKQASIVSIEKRKYSVLGIK